MFLAPSMSAACYAAAPPVGFVVVATSPVSSVATHRATDPHDTLVRGPGDRIGVRVQAPGPPVGSVVVSTAFAPSIATQRLTAGHEMSWRPVTLSTAVEVHGPLPGSVVVSTFEPSIATHSVADGHEIAPIGP